MQREIAVIGGNVAGLSAAYHLTRQGYYVTVYERKKWNKPCGGAISLEFEQYLQEELAIEFDDYSNGIPLFRVGLWSGRYIEDEGVFTVNTRYDLQSKLTERLREEPNLDIIEKRISSSDLDLFTPQTIVATGYSSFTKQIMGHNFPNNMLALRFEGKLDCTHPNAHLIILDNRVMGYGWVFIGKNDHLNTGFGADVSRETLIERFQAFLQMIKTKYGYEIDISKGKPRNWVLPLPVNKGQYPVMKMKEGIEFIGVGDVLGLAHSITGAGIEPAWQSGWVLAASLDPVEKRIDSEKYRYLLSKNLSLTSGRRLDRLMGAMTRKKFVPFKDSIGYMGLKIFRHRVLNLMRKYPWFALVHDGKKQTDYVNRYNLN